MIFHFIFTIFAVLFWPIELVGFGKTIIIVVLYGIGSFSLWAMIIDIVGKRFIEPVWPKEEV